MFTNTAHNQTSGSVRIRADGGNEWQYDAIEKAANFYDCNRSNAVAFACEDVNQLIITALRGLERDDLTRKQHRDISEILSTRDVG
ncbi:DUF7692 domain-containing protein [Natronoglomus mannanivorans]|uniref:DUF7692 domain-containing protein n=1 Tax=Natronoglomus mannanivorans TaxID=2979990 RepID=A0AAP3E4W5_9EURY|nr:hypothetical protein [Halobacteria archaeon AArc-xg1-1]MCU4744622.1 hypothetical protein [Halobacteria archaeon AArc-xg1-1]